MTDRDRRNIEVDRLVSLSQRGDREAFAKLYDTFVVSVYRHIYFRVNVEDAEDLTEMVFLKAWEYLPKYQKQPQASFSAWLFTIVRNLLVDYYRMNVSHDSLDDHVADDRLDSDPTHPLKCVLDQKTLKLALQQLKDRYQQVIILKFINDLSNEEIAHTLGRSVGNIRVLQFRALKELKSILQQMGINHYE